MGNLNGASAEEVESLRASLIEEISRANSSEDSRIEDLLEMETGLKDLGYSNEQIYQAYILGAKDAESAIRILSEEQFYTAPSTDCLICGSLEPLHAVGSCLHSFCKSCLEEFLELKVNEGQVLGITCPFYKCSTSLNDSLIRQMTSPSVFDRYVVFKRRAEAESNINLRSCPRPDCQGYGALSLNTSRIVCSVCSYEFCSECLQPWHPDTECEPEVDSAMERYAQQHRVKSCPNCRRRVEKIEGCDHMTCLKCKHEFCWLCGYAYTSDHFEGCPVLIYKRKVPSWTKIWLMWAAPVLLPFAMPLLCLYYYNEIENQLRQDYECFFRSRLRAKFLLALFSFLLTPLAVVVAVPTYTVYAVSHYLSNQADEQLLNTENRSCSRSLYLNSFFRCSASLLSGLFVIPASIVMAVIAHLAAWVWSCFRVYLSIRRCCEPSYMLPQLQPGFTL